MPDKDKKAPKGEAGTEKKQKTQKAGRGTGRKARLQMYKATDRKGLNKKRKIEKQKRFEAKKLEKLKRRMEAGKPVPSKSKLLKRGGAGA